MLTHEYPPYPGGVGRYCASMAAAARRMGHEVTVLAPSHGGPTATTQVDGVEVIRFDGDVFHFKQLRPLIQRIRQLLQTRPFDLVHAADWPTVIALGKLKTPRGTQRIATLHGTDVILIRQSIRARLTRAGAALAKFDRYACNSAYTQGLLKQHFPRLHARTVVTPLGVDAEWFQTAPLDHQTAFRQAIHAKDDDLLVLTVARLDPRKGQKTTIEALAGLPPDLKARVRYVCVGKEVVPGYADQLTQLAKERGVQLVLTGRLPDESLKAAYACATVFALTGEVVPGKVEGFGLVLLEAAAQGLPAVVTHVQALPEVVVHQTTGWVCEGTEALTQAFEQALLRTDPALKAACVQHASHFTWDRCAALTYVGPTARPA